MGEVKDLPIEELQRKIECCYEIKQRVNAIANLFIKRGSGVNVQFDDTIEAPAQIDMTDFRITLNPKMIAEIFQKNFPEVDDYIYESQELSIMVVGFVLHEIAHYLYSPGPVQMEEAYKKFSFYSDNGEIKPVPVGFVSLTSNFVEDSHIQTQFLKDFPSKLYYKAIQMLQNIIQGGEGLKEYEEALKQGMLSVENQLFYLILRAYNPDNGSIKNFFGHRELFAFSDISLKKFDEALFHINTDERCKYVAGTVAPSLYEDLKNFYKDNPPPPPPPGKPPIGPGGDPPIDGQPPIGPGGDPPVDPPTDPPIGPGGQPGNNPPKEPKDPIDIDEKIGQAIDNIMKKIFENKNRGELKDDKKKKTSAKGHAAAGSGCFCHPLTGEATSIGQVIGDMYTEFSANLSKIHNIENTRETRLDEGDRIDVDLLPEFEMEGNLDIYEENLNLVQNKNIVCSFIVDASGSMGMHGRSTQCKALTTSICHALEDIGMKTSVILFADCADLVKDYDEPLVFESGRSNLLYALSKYWRSGGTSPSGAFHMLEEMGTGSSCDEDTIKILFFITDGETSKSEKKQVMESVDNLTAAGWLIFPIGIDFNRDTIEEIEEMLNGIKVKNYTSSELSTKLPEDLYNVLEDQILIK